MFISWLYLKTEKTCTQCSIKSFNDSLIAMNVHDSSPVPHVVLRHLLLYFNHKFTPGATEGHLNGPLSSSTEKHLKLPKTPYKWVVQRLWIWWLHRPPSVRIWKFSSPSEAGHEGGKDQLDDPNRPFPSSLAPLFQNESKCETFHMKMSSACSFIFMQIKVIFIRMVSQLDSLWNRGKREPGFRNGLFGDVTSNFGLVKFLGRGRFMCQMACFVNQSLATSSETPASWANFFTASNTLQKPLGM